MMEEAKKYIDSIERMAKKNAEKWPDGPHNTDWCYIGHVCEDMRTAINEVNNNKFSFENDSTPERIRPLIDMYFAYEKVDACVQIMEQMAVKNTISQSDDWSWVLRICAAIQEEVLGRKYDTATEENRDDQTTFIRQAFLAARGQEINQLFADKNKSVSFRYHDDNGKPDFWPEFYNFDQDSITFTTRKYAIVDACNAFASEGETDPVYVVRCTYIGYDSTTCTDILGYCDIPLKDFIRADWKAYFSNILDHGMGVVCGEATGEK